MVVGGCDYVDEIEFGWIDDQLGHANVLLVSVSVFFGEHQIVADLGLPGYMPYDIDDRGRILIVEGSYDSPKPPVLLLNWRQQLEGK